MATAWGVAAAGWAVTVLGWFLSPVFRSLLPKILAYLGFDASKKLLELEIHIIPELQQTMRAVDEERMMQREKKLRSDLATLDKMAAMLRHAREDAEDIFDDAQEKIISRCWCCHRLLYRAFVACKRSLVWVARVVVQRNSARLLRWAWKIVFLRRSEDVLPMTARVVASSNESATVTEPSDSRCNSSDSDEPAPVAEPLGSSQRWLSCWCCSLFFDFFNNCCRSMFYWLVHVIDFARFYRDWSYDVVGITSYQENATALDFVLTAISRRKLKKRIEKVESTINEVNKSQLLCVASKSKPDDIANKNRWRIRSAIKRKVFGREKLRDYIMANIRATPTRSGTSPCYSVIGIYGVAGSGKTTFAGYIRDYIKGCKDKLFDNIMCIHVSETFSVEDIFQEMLKDITEDSLSNISDHGGLKNKLMETLRGKRFFLILDDLWVKNKNDQQLEELISPLSVGKKGSKILVTARTKDAAGALCADELIEMPDLDEDKYLKMFVHYALDGTSFAREEFVSVGREIAKKLRRSPIAAVTVAGRLGTNRDMNFWKNTANYEKFNETMDALWWSYQQLNPDIRRCLEYCNIFPRRSKLNKDDLVRLWIAQGFVKTSCTTENIEDIAEGYIQELVSCSFLQPEGTSWNGTDCFTVHDLLRDLADKVVGSDCFSIENEWSQRGDGWKRDVPQDVRHLFVQNYDAKLITEKILGLKNLRTLIIYAVGQDMPVEENVIESMCKRLLKLRVLGIAFSPHGAIGEPNRFSVPKSISELKHLRYLTFKACKLILPSTLAKLHHIQLLDFDGGQILEFTFDDLINLQHMFCRSVSFPNIGRLSSLQTIPNFTVRREKGYEIKQLRDLNKLSGILRIYGLRNVKSKEEALEANLGAKERLNKLALCWTSDDTRCSSEVETEVLEGLSPPTGLDALSISDYKGSRYPDWMVGNQNVGPKNLQELWFTESSQLRIGPIHAFPHLRCLGLTNCSWDALPGNMKHLTSLKRLVIVNCLNICLLPTLPRSLELLQVCSCNREFMKSCQTVRHRNWQKIKHIPDKVFTPPIYD
ncbi:putative disease resistance protein RGA1 [Hordeum vulgare]|nr:putative disease resistance protein RGA1 [Hordeum vulgare]